jgi:hypothetical protein
LGEGGNPVRTLLVTSYLVSLVAAAGLVAGACDSEPRPSKQPTPNDLAATVKQPTAPAKARDACALLTKAEAEAILGVPVSPEPREADPGESMCYYDAGSEPGFGLKVMWSGGRQALDLTRKTQPVAGGLIKRDAMDAAIVAGLTALEPVGGLGDEAYFNLRESYVRKGDALLDFMLQELVQAHIAAGHTDPPQGLKEKWTALARTAVARL